MADPVPPLRAKWSPPNRYANFGSAVRSLRIQGFRGIADFAIDLAFPITAISGLNGSGKSTIGSNEVAAIGIASVTHHVAIHPALAKTACASPVKPSGAGMK